jgi:hypothetical protein
MYLLTVVWIDDDKINSVELGGISHQTPAAQKKSWTAVPAATGKTSFVLEMRDQWQSLQESKPISAGTVEALLGVPAATLLASERRNTLLTIAQLQRNLRGDKR